MCCDFLRSIMENSQCLWYQQRLIGFQSFLSRQRKINEIAVWNKTTPFVNLGKNYRNPKDKMKFSKAAMFL